MMTSQKQRMLAGELYDPLDPELAADRMRARELMHRLNATAPRDTRLLTELVAALLPNVGAGLLLEPPFYCDYGENIHAGERVFFNFNCVVLDVMPVSIGSDVLFGPAVQIYTAMHPLAARERRAGLEFAQPVSIGDGCWFGGNVTVCPGVDIGRGAVIGAGSVVTADIPGGCFAAGNPCRVRRTGLDSG